MDEDTIGYIQHLGQGVIAPLSPWGEGVMRRSVHKHAMWNTGLRSTRGMLELHTPDERYIIAHMRHLDKNTSSNLNDNTKDTTSHHMYYIIRPITIPQIIYTNTGIHHAMHDTLHLAATIRHTHLLHTHAPTPTIHHIIHSLRHRPKAPQDLFDRIRHTYLSMTAHDRAAMHHDIHALFPSIVSHGTLHKAPTERAPEFIPTIQVTVEDIHTYYSKTRSWPKRNQAVNGSHHESLEQRRRMHALIDTMRIQYASLCNPTPEDTPR